MERAFITRGLFSGRGVRWAVGYGDGGGYREGRGRGREREEEGGEGEDKPRTVTVFLPLITWIGMGILGSLCLGVWVFWFGEEGVCW